MECEKCGHQEPKPVALYMARDDDGLWLFLGKPYWSNRYKEWIAGSRGHKLYSVRHMQGFPKVAVYERKQLAITVIEKKQGEE